VYDFCYYCKNIKQWRTGVSVKLSGIFFSTLLVITLLTGCSRLGLVTGKGNIVALAYNFSNFSKIEAGSAFEIEITPSDTYDVAITTYENILDYVDISVTDNTLKIKLKSGKYANIRPKATVKMPVLDRVILSGASRGSAKGFKITQDLEISESRASSLEIDFQANNAVLNISGASKLEGHLEATSLKMDVSGASRAELNGSANNLTLTVSGASQANLTDLPLQIADANISGASRGNITVNGKLNIDLSGASSLTYGGNPALGNVSVTGASSLNPQK
jgi:hypothetical protein